MFSIIRSLNLSLATIGKDMSDNLYNEFSAVSKSAFKEKIIKDLKGKDFDSALLWSVEEQTVQPFYHSEDLNSLLEKYKGNLQHSSKFQQGNDWSILEVVSVDNATQANKAALQALNNGVEAICFDLKQSNLDNETYASLVNEVLLDVAPIRFTNFKNLTANNLSKEVVVSQDFITNTIKQNHKVDSSFHQQLKSQIESKTAFNVAVDIASYQNAGATIIDQLAFGIAILSEYLQACTSIAEQDHITGITFQAAVGSNFFFEVAKLRALRKLVAVLLKQFGLENLPIHIEATSTGINKSRLDENNNMLRNTSECMAAIVGGANAVQINAHDYLTAPTANGKRWARNIAHILRKESYLDKVNDPTKGSYYVEEITDTIANTAWEEFKQIEAKGGFLAAISKGIIQEKILKNVNALKVAIESKKMVLVGVNKYEPTNAPELPKIQEQSNTSFLKPLRLAESFE